MSLMELSCDEPETRGVYQAKAFDVITHDWAVSSLNGILGLSDEFPGYLDREALEDVVTGYIEYTTNTLLKEQVSPRDQALWDAGLRQRALVAAESACRDCQKCKLYENSPCNVPADTGLAPTPVFGEGRVDAPVMLLAEAPGQIESRTGLPMVGQVELRRSPCATTCKHFEPCFLDRERFVHHVSRPCSYEAMTAAEWEVNVPRRIRKRGELNTAGEMLDRCLGEAELVRNSAHVLRDLLIRRKVANPPEPPESNVYITNAVRHHPSTAEGKNRAPTVPEMRACGPWLAITIRLVRPKVIVALGSHGLTALGPLAPIGGILSLCPESLDAEPTVLATKLHPIVFPCVHPAFVMRAKQDNPKTRYEEKIVQILTAARLRAERE